MDEIGHYRAGRGLDGILVELGSGFGLIFSDVVDLLILAVLIAMSVSGVVFGRRVIKAIDTLSDLVEDIGVDIRSDITENSKSDGHLDP